MGQVNSMDVGGVDCKTGESRKTSISLSQLPSIDRIWNSVASWGWAAGGQHTVYESKDREEIVLSWDSKEIYKDISIHQHCESSRFISSAMQLEVLPSVF